MMLSKTLRRGAITALLLLHCASSVESAACESWSPVDIDVVVIGAGLSGLIAAKRFEEYNAGKPPSQKLEYTILEGQDHWGGRAISARWVNGPKSPVYALAEEAGIPMQQQDFKSFDTYKKVGKKWEKVSHQDERKARNKFKQAFKCMNNYANKFFRNNWKDKTAIWVLRKKCGWPRRPTPLQRMEQWRGGLNWDYSTESPSIMNFPEDIINDFNRKTYYIRDGRGSEAIADYIAEESTDPPMADNIKLNAEVYSVKWNRGGEDRALVEAYKSDDTSVCVAKYAAKYVIPTVSPGVIRAHPNMFTPPLEDANHRNVFDMVNYEIARFTFQEKFWDGQLEKEFVSFLPKKAANVGMCNHFMNLDIGGVRRLRGLAPGGQGNDPTFMPGSKTLICYSVTEELNKFNPNFQSYPAEKLLKPLFDTFNNKNPVAYSVFRTDNAHSHWTEGAMANWIVDKNKRADENLAQYNKFFEPRINDKSGKPIVLIAGTAGCFRYWEYTSGAILSGEITGDKVLKLYDGTYEIGDNAKNGACDLD